MIAFLTLSAGAKVTVENAWVRQMPPGMDVTAGFMVVKNDGKKTEIKKIKAGFAKVAELHTHVVEEGIMQMRKVDSMTVPAKGELKLRPHGKHIMFFGVKSSLKAGDKEKVEIILSNGEKIEAQFEIKGMKDGE